MHSDHVLGIKIILLPSRKQSTDLGLKIHILAGNLNFLAKIVVINPYKHSTYANLVCHHQFAEALDSQANQWGKFCTNFCTYSRWWAEILCLVTYNIILAINMVSRAYMQQKVVAIVVKMGSQYAQLLRNWLEMASILFMGCWDTTWLCHIYRGPRDSLGLMGKYCSKVGQKVDFL